MLVWRRALAERFASAARALVPRVCVRLSVKRRVSLSVQGGSGCTRIALASCTLTCHPRHTLRPPTFRRMRGTALATMATPGGPREE